jgi:hypothetical protein
MTPEKSAFGSRNPVAKPLPVFSYAMGAGAEQKVGARGGPFCSPVWNHPRFLPFHLDLILKLSETNIYQIPCQAAIDIAGSGRNLRRKPWSAHMEQQKGRLAQFAVLC